LHLQLQQLQKLPLEYAKEAFFYEPKHWSGFGPRLAVQPGFCYD
jgi:hypothetical protein